MALTTSEEALVRQLLDQQAAILSLAGNEATITSKLGATKVTLADLVAASGVADADLLLMRQGTTDKSVTPLLLKGYAQDGMATQKAVQAGDYNTSVAGGTADAITGDYTPNVLALEDGLTLFVRASAANTTTTPTFAPDGLTAKTIVKGNNLALGAGDIAGAGHWLEMNFDSVLDKWVLQNPAFGVSQATSASIQGAFKNLALSATGTNSNVSVTADEISLEDAANAYVTARAVSLTINTAASGANGLDTGTLAASTWYSVWVIRNAAGAVAGLVSLSGTSPAMPAGYTFKARVGWIRTDSTANKWPLSFTQKGCDARYKQVAGSNLTNLPNMLASAAAQASYAAIGVSAFVPPTASHIEIVGNSALNTNGGVSPNADFGSVNTIDPPAIGWQGAATASAIYANFNGTLALESTNIFWYQTTPQSGTTWINCYGWRDNL